LVSVTLLPSPSINIIHGANGSGKTSLLEAIYFLGMARSFRSHKIKPIIRSGQQSCTVFGKVFNESQSWNLGVSRDLGANFRIHINGESSRHTSPLAATLPLLVINPDTFRLLEGSPKDRRHFLDWGVFHVEHQFLDTWKKFQKAMKQRNALLRHGKIDSSLLNVWNTEFIRNGELIDKFRNQYFDQLKPVFEETIAQLCGVEGIQLSYQRGWDKERSLAEVLEKTLSRDQDAGYTQWGPHRADIRVRYKSVAAVDSLSRGQQKIVVSALKLAQGHLYRCHKKQGCVYLIDDLPSELDQAHRARLCTMLENMKSQVFITCVEKDSLDSIWQPGTQVKMFHVKHGTLTESERSVVNQVDSIPEKTDLMDAG
ncbi:MAG: DNA replication/repair protein RecF, partial [Desulfovibrionales bacterium]|nr:DNA replication/repair protein RecF [Desulfovibrionales bacterium]